MVDLTPVPSPLYPAQVLLWHQRQRGPVEWRVTASGVETKPTALAPPTLEQLALLRSIRARYGAMIDAAASAFQVPAELIEATIATESSGRADSTRIEPGYLSDRATPHRLSVGLMQTLISTAQGACPGRQVTRAWLLQPQNSIAAGTAYIAAQRRVTAYDPPLVAAAYNAGGLYHEPLATNPWRLRCYPMGTGSHISKFVRHLNAAVAVRQRSL
jgi:soluble lytic murein transglycosylase-like protein